MIIWSIRRTRSKSNGSCSNCSGFATRRLLFFTEKQKPPVELLRSAGVGIAIATDSNPGLSPTTSLLLMMSMACQFFSLTVSEVLSAVTYQAARALGMEHEIGVIAPGKAADLVLWSVTNSAALCYYFAYPLSHRTMIAGEWQSF